MINAYRRLQREKQGQLSVTETAKEVVMPRFRGSLKIQDSEIQDSDELEKKKKKNKRGGGAKKGKKKKKKNNKKKKNKKKKKNE